MLFKMFEIFLWLLTHAVKYKLRFNYLFLLSLLPFLAVPVAAGQADYSAAWVEYYRSLGMYREAEMIEQQARGGQAPVSTFYLLS